MGLITTTKHINELEKLQSGIRLNVVKGVKTADYPCDSFEGIQNTAKKTNFYSRIKNYFSELFVACKRPCRKPKPAKISHTEGSKPIIEGEQTYNYIDCDLHPRVSPSGRYVCCDVCYTGKRSLFIMAL